MWKCQNRHVPQTSHWSEKWIEKSVRIFNNLLHFACSEKERSQFDCLEDTILEVCLWEFKLWQKHAVVTWVLLLSCRCVRNANYDEALDLEAFVSKLATMHSRWLEEHSFWCAPNHMWGVLLWSPFTSASVLMKFFGWWGRLPVIQSLVADVRQTTEALLAQLLQRLQSNIQVKSLGVTYVSACRNR
jgi:hypothetical protein